MEITLPVALLAGLVSFASPCFSRTRLAEVRQFNVGGFRGCAQQQFLEVCCAVG